MIRRLAYFSRTALSALRRSPWVSVLCAGTIGVALLLVGTYAMMLQNLEGLTRVWGRAGNVSCYIAATVPKDRWDGVRRNLAALPGVERAQLVTPAEALARFRARGTDAATLVEGVSEDILPAAVELSVQGGFTDLKAVGALAGAARAVSGVEAVDFGEEEFSRLAGLIELLRYGGGVAGAFLAVATAFLVANTIRLTVYARRDEIAILRLVGATHGFIRVPFLMEGALW
ncbi:MAG TPA: permease-like cell division protein FtsX, partial [Myxococcota bacterium]|nr:permease-like cell division protein FtsX [Myxococcota bacterium]